MPLATGETQRPERGLQRAADPTVTVERLPAPDSFRRDETSTFGDESGSVSKIKKAHEGTTSAINDGWIGGGNLFSAIAAGTLVGLGLDAWLNTSPWLVVVGIIGGSITGFYSMWDQMKEPQGRRDIFTGRPR